MKGTFEHTLVIKPCVENPKLLNIRATTLESIHEKIFRESDNPFRKKTTFLQWALREEAICAWIMSEEKGMYTCAHILSRIDANPWMCDSNSWKDMEYLRYKIENFYPVKIAQKYYQDVISMQSAYSIFIEAGEYLIELSGTSDLLESDWSIRDIKYYASKFWDTDDEEYEVYTLDNFKDSKLRQLSQRYIYPVLHGNEWTSYFYYDMYPKSKNAPSKKNPENYLKRTVYKCEVDIDKAKEQIKKDVIRYFRLCKQRDITPWEKIIHS